MYSKKFVVVIMMLVWLCFYQSIANAVIIGYPAVAGNDAGSSTEQRTLIDPPFQNGSASSSTTSTAGKLIAWRLYAWNTGTLYLQVYRPVADGYKLIGHNQVTISSTGVFTTSISADNQISVEPGDFLGHTGRISIIPEVIISGGHYGNWKTYDSTNWPSYAKIPWPTATTIGTVVESRRWDVNPPDVSLDGLNFIEYPGDAGYTGNDGRPHSLAAEIVYFKLQTFSSSINSEYANGQNKITINIEIRNADNTPYTNLKLSISASGSRNVVIQPGPTDSNGRATATISSTIPGEKTITLTALPVSAITNQEIGVTLGTLKVTFMGPPVLGPDEGGELLAYTGDKKTKLIVPPRTISKTVQYIIERNFNPPSISDGLARIIDAYSFVAKDVDTGATISNLTNPVTVVIHVSADGTRILDSSGVPTDITINDAYASKKLGISFHNGISWLPLTSNVTVDSDRTGVSVSAKTTHLTQFAVTSNFTFAGDFSVNVSPNPFTPKASQYNAVNFTFKNNDNENVELKIWDITGSLVKLINAYGVSSISWDGKDENGEYVEGGVYIYQLKVGNNKTKRGTVVVAY